MGSILPSSDKIKKAEYIQDNYRVFLFFFSFCFFFFLEEIWSREEGCVSCHSANWHSLLLMLLGMTLHSSVSPVCGLQSFMIREMGTKVFLNALSSQEGILQIYLLSILEGKAQTLVSSARSLASIRACDELWWRDLHIFLKNKSHDARQQIFGRVKK